jgi:glucokinase
MAVIALDLGGTKLASALVSQNGKVQQRQAAALEKRTGMAVGDLIRGQVRNLLGFAKVRRIKVTAVGVSVPGIAYPEPGTVWAPNIPGWKEFPLRRVIQQETSSSIPVELEGDRACYILGEQWQGCANSCRDAIFLSIGTGIAAGILSDGRIIRGAEGIAGSIGWFALSRPFLTPYVQTGCFEHHASGPGLVKVAIELLQMPGAPASRLRADTVTTRDIFAAYEEGDPIARAVLDQAIVYWGMGLANLVSVLNPEMIIFGGGVFGPAKQFVQAIRAEALKWSQPVAMRRVKLRTSRLGGDAGLLGAAKLGLNSKI